MVGLSMSVTWRNGDEALAYPGSSGDALVTPSSPDFPLVFDNSMLNSLRNCPRQYELTYIDNWKAKRENIHLHAGKSFAAGLEVTRRSFFNEGRSVEDSTALGLGALIQAYGNYECPPDSPKSLERLAQALEYYFSIWPLDEDKAQPKKMPSGKHAIEFSFVEPLEVNHPITGEPILYCGRSDSIVTIAGGTFIEDDKTTSSLGASWPDQWELRAQFTGYCWAARKAGIPVDGVLVRGIAILKTKFNHAQHITYRPEWEIARWLDQTHVDIDRAITLWKGGHYDYNLGDACNAYGGCQFRSICKRRNPEEWLPAYFAKRKWDPVTRTEEEIE